MIFSRRRKAGRPAKQDNSPTVVCIKTHDIDFAAKVGVLLGQWGYATLVVGGEGGDEENGVEVDVALLDIRGMSDDAYGQLTAIRQRYPGVEVVLVNKPDNVAASIAGMRAGAGDELILPFDTAALEKAVDEACKRRRAARDKATRKPLLTRFSEAMMAATFAQAGDFDGALELMDSPSRPKK